jgi:hypothetical protein
MQYKYSKSDITLKILFLKWRHHWHGSTHKKRSCNHADVMLKRNRHEHAWTQLRSSKRLQRGCCVASFCSFPWNFIPNDVIRFRFDVIWYFRCHNTKTKFIPNLWPAQTYLVRRISGANFGNLLHMSSGPNSWNKLSANHNRSTKPLPLQKTTMK